MKYDLSTTMAEVGGFEVKGYQPRDEGVYVTYATPGKQVARFAMRDERTVFLLVFNWSTASTRVIRTCIA
jgi:hypothetical protein